MGCNCSLTEKIIGVVIIVLAIWPNVIGATNSKWVIVVAAAVLIIHAFKCSACNMPAGSDMKKPLKKKKRK